MTPDLLPERIRSKISVQPDGCWHWTAARFSWTGYGQIRGYQSRLAHRATYEELVGPIPAGLVIDHLCRVKHCVNPAHLEPVTQSVNCLRGMTGHYSRGLWTHCIRGHEFTDENTSWDRNTRRCRTCSAALARQRRAARRQQVTT